MTPHPRVRLLTNERLAQLCATVDPRTDLGRALAAEQARRHATTLAPSVVPPQSGGRAQANSAVRAGLVNSHAGTVEGAIVLSGRLR